jgi:hypothetical protein
MQEVAMSYLQRVVAFLIVGCASIILASCGFNPLSGGTSQAPAVKPTPSKTATASVTATASTPAAPARTSFAKTSAPRLYDPLLANGSWGYHSKKKLVQVKLSDGVTLALHEDLRQAETDALTAEQQKSLLKVFKNSSKVHRWIDAQGGESSDATYSVVAIQASTEVGNDTPWVYATLRAGFPTEHGVKAIDCFVYRQKTDRGLDMRPFVSNAIAYYQASDGVPVDPTRVRVR